MKRERGKKREPLFSSFFIQKCLFSSFSILKKVIYLCSPNRNFIVYNTGYNTNFLFIGKTLLSLSALRNVNVLIQIKTSILFSFFEPAQIKNWGQSMELWNTCKQGVVVKILEPLFCFLKIPSSSLLSILSISLRGQHFNEYTMLITPDDDTLPCQRLLLAIIKMHTKPLLTRILELLLMENNVVFLFRYELRKHC